MMILAILFLAIISFAGGNIIKKGLSSLGIIQEKTDNEANCLVLFDKTHDKDGDGYYDGEKDGVMCDKCDTDPTKHGDTQCDS